MRLSVSVPVLSEQMTLTDPSVSTLGRRRTSAFTPTNRRAPRASKTVTTAGNASGMAATARLIAVSAISSSGLAAQYADCKDQRTDRQHDNRQPLAERRQPLLQRRRAALGSTKQHGNLTEFGLLAGGHDQPVARPCVTSVPLNAMLVRSPSGNARSEWQIGRATSQP